MLNEQARFFLKENFCDKFAFDAETLHEIYTKTQILTLQKEQNFYAGEGCAGFVLVKSGVLRAFLSPDGVRQITIFELKARDACALCDSCRSSVAAQGVVVEARQKSELLLVPQVLFERLKADPEVLKFTLSLVSERFASVAGALLEALFLPLEVRVLRHLRELSDVGRSECEVAQVAQVAQVAITHEALARELGSARVAVSRVLKTLEKNGDIAQKRGKILLLNGNL